MADPFIGEVRMFGGYFAPEGFAFCDGQLLSVSQHSDLFSLIGTIYGGDGESTFGLPDLRGRTPIHMGTGADLSPRLIGQRLGTEDETINANTMPTHTHSINASSDTVSESNPTNNLPGKDTTPNLYRNAAFPPPGQTTMNNAMVQNTGGSQRHNNMMPFLAVHFIIALYGIYPSET